MNDDFYRVAVIGAGEVGSRHLQALALLERPIKIFVVDPSNKSLRIAKERFQQVCSIEQMEQVNYLENVSDLKENIDIAIVSTNAKVRREVIEKLLINITVRRFILEKVVFQAVEDFAFIHHLLQQKQIPTWVNCPNRLFPFYKNLKNKINSETPISFQVSGGNWGLGSNSIHYLDLFVFLTGATDIHFFGGGLHSATIDSKREGYKEFTGTLLGTTEKGDQLTFCSLPENKAPLLIQIMTSQERYILSESDQKALSSTKDGQWKWEVEEFNILYQSQLTHLVVEEIFEKGDCSLGSHLTEELVRKGYETKAFVLYNSFNSWGWLDHCGQDVRDQFEVFAGDIRDPHGVRKAMEGCEAVLHLAALIAIPYSYHSPDTYVDTNIKGTLNVVQAARDLEVSKVVHTSTSEVYGTAKFVPITEEHPLKGQSPYSASKIGADQIAMSFYNSFSIPVSILRPFNTYGPRQSARAVIPTVILQIANNKREIKLGALKPTRDFNYVEDTVSGFIAALESDQAIGEVVHLGSNFEISIGDTVNTIADLMGTEIEILTDPQRLRPDKSEVERLWADNRKAKELLGWQPQYGELEGFRKGLEKTVKWFSNAENLMYYKSDHYNL